MDTPEVQALLERPRGYVRASASTCNTCKAKVEASFRFCSGCGASNEKFSEISGAVAQGGKTQGYSRKQEPWADVSSVVNSIPPASKAHLSKAMGDIVAQMRSRKPAAPGSPSLEATAVEPSTPAPANSSKSAPSNPLATPKASQQAAPGTPSCLPKGSGQATAVQLRRVRAEC